MRSMATPARTTTEEREHAPRGHQAVRNASHRSACPFSVSSSRSCPARYPRWFPYLRGWPGWRSWPSKPEQPPDQLDHLGRSAVPGDLLQMRGGRMQQLVDDGGRRGVDGGLLLGAECAEPLAGPLDLRPPDRLRTLPEVGEQRCNLEGLLPFEERVHLALDDGLGGGGFLAALAQVRLRDRLQVVEVIEEHVGQLADLRLHVPRHRDVDEEERATPRPHGRGHVLLADNGVRRAGAADHDV